MGLFKPAWMGKNEDKALKALNKVSDAAMLKEVVETAPLESVRLAAVDKLTDQSLLAMIAANDTVRGENVRIAAIRKLTDQDILEKTAIKLWGSLRYVAIKQLSDTNLARKLYAEDAMKMLADQALRSKDSYHQVLKEIKDETVLAGILMKAKNEHCMRDANCMHVVMNALDRITDQNTLVTLSKSAAHRAIRYAALSRLDQSILIDIAMNDDDVYTRIAAAGYINDISLIPAIQKDRCKEGLHIFKTVSQQRQQRQFGSSSYTRKCIFCGEVDSYINDGD